jgi:hypothetical protein
MKSDGGAAAAVCLSVPQVGPKRDGGLSDFLQEVMAPFRAAAKNVGRDERQLTRASLGVLSCNPRLSCSAGLPGIAKGPGSLCLQGDQGLSIGGDGGI